MKKNIFAFVAILIASFSFFSCSSSDKDKGPVDEIENILDYPYSKLSVEDQKKKLTAEGEATAKKVEGLGNEKSAILLNSFNDLYKDLIDVLQETETSPTPAPAAREEAASEIIKLAQYHGEYTWDAEKEEWERKGDAEKLILHLPAKTGEVTNNGRIVIEAITSTININGNEIPSNVVAELFVSDKKEGEITAIAKGINESTFAETVDVTLDLGEYDLVVNLIKKGSENESTVEFTKGADLIVDAFVDFEANITAEMIQNEDVSSIKDANFICNISAELASAGYVNGKVLIAELQRIEKELDEIDEEYWNSAEKEELEEEILALLKERVVAVNANSNIALVSKSEEHKIAKVAMELVSKKVEKSGSKLIVDEDGEPILDENGYQQYERYTYSGYDTSEIVIFNFDDKTKVEAKVFFSEGFDKVMNQWKDIINMFN